MIDTYRLEIAREYLRNARALLTGLDRESAAQALRELSAVEREIVAAQQQLVVQLRNYEGWSFTRIADALGVSKQAVAKRYGFACEKANRSDIHRIRDEVVGQLATTELPGQTTVDEQIAESNGCPGPVVVDRITAGRAAAEGRCLSCSWSGSWVPDEFTSAGILLHNHDHSAETSETPAPARCVAPELSASVPAVSSRPRSAAPSRTTQSRQEKTRADVTCPSCGSSYDPRASWVTEGRARCYGCDMKAAGVTGRALSFPELDALLAGSAATTEADPDPELVEFDRVGWAAVYCDTCGVEAGEPCRTQPDYVYTRGYRPHGKRKRRAVVELGQDRAAVVPSRVQL